MVRPGDHRSAGANVLAGPLAFRPERADAPPQRRSHQGFCTRGAGRLPACIASEVATLLVVAVETTPTNGPEPRRQGVAPVSAGLPPNSNELEELRARILALETELLGLEASANCAVAEAQEKTYWLDRWRIDINAIMDRNATRHVLAATRRARALYGTVRRVNRSAR
jgi:hypothetical protein